MLPFDDLRVVVARDDRPRSVCLPRRTESPGRPHVDARHGVVVSQCVFISPTNKSHRITQPDRRHVAEDTEPHPDQSAVELPEDEAGLVETPGGDELTERAATLATARTKLTGDLSPGAFPASHVAWAVPVYGRARRVSRERPRPPRDSSSRTPVSARWDRRTTLTPAETRPGDATPRTTLRPGSSGHGSVGRPDPDTTASVLPPLATSRRTGVRAAGERSSWPSARERRAPRPVRAARPRTGLVDGAAYEPRAPGEPTGTASDLWPGVLIRDAGRARRRHRH